MRYHRHAGAFITIVLSGEYVEVRDALPILCRDRSIVLHDALEEHADRFARDTRCLNVEFSSDAVGSMMSGRTSDQPPTLRDAVESVVRAFYSCPHQLNTAVKNLYNAIRMQPPESSHVRPQWWYRVIEDFPWTQPVPLREAAAMCELHEAHFSRAFRRHLGITANEYRARARIQLASKLLLTTSASIAGVAFKAGFSDQSHLTRFLTERLGLSPAGYRRIFSR